MGLHRHLPLPPRKDAAHADMVATFVRDGLASGSTSFPHVSHPAPESRGSKPSIAAIVGSIEPKAANYQVEVRVQDGAQNEEVIHDMRNVTKNLLLKFHEANKGRKPEKIIMYRDGVSEGQFLTVLASELVAMRAACRELDEDYKPQITYIIVQKRHHEVGGLFVNCMA